MAVVAALVCLLVLLVAYVLSEGGASEVAAVHSDTPNGALPSCARVIGEAEWNAGAVVSGEKVSHVFILENEGRTPLHITKVVKTCGCTEAAVSPDTIGAHEQAMVSVSVDTTRKTGRTSVSVHICADPNDSYVATMSITATVGKSAILTLNPDTIEVGDAPGGTAFSVPAQLIAKARCGARMPLIDHATFEADGGLHVSLRPGCESYSEGLFECTSAAILVTGTVPPEGGRFRFSVRVHDGEHDDVNGVMQIRGFSESAYTVQPSSIFCDDLSGTTGCARTVSITLTKWRSDGELQATASADWIALTIVPSEHTATAKTIHARIAPTQMGVSTGSITLSLCGALQVIPVVARMQP
jgi:hypothetical protein